MYSTSIYYSLFSRIFLFKYFYSNFLYIFLHLLFCTVWLVDSCGTGDRTPSRDQLRHWQRRPGWDLTRYFAKCLIRYFGKCLNKKLGSISSSKCWEKQLKSSCCIYNNQNNHQGDTRLQLEVAHFWNLFLNQSTDNPYSTIPSLKESCILAHYLNLSNYFLRISSD